MISNQEAHNTKLLPAMDPSSPEKSRYVHRCDPELRCQLIRGVLIQSNVSKDLE